VECWHCGRPAAGVCVFCGRAVCKEHAQHLPNVITIFRDTDDVNKAVVVADALYCGVCSPRDEPVPLEGLERGEQPAGGGKTV